MNTDTNLRPLWPALRKGLRGKCPNCGKGKALHNYLQVRHSCAHCGEDLHHARADDGPAYLTILIVGKILVPMIYVLYVNFTLHPLIMAGLLSAMAIVLSLVLLPILKAFIVAFQWSQRMGGFDKNA